MIGKRTKTWLYLGLGAAGLALLGTSAAAVARPGGAGGGNGSGGGAPGTSCNYPPPGQPLPGKNRKGLRDKIAGIIFKENPGAALGLTIPYEAYALAGALDMGLPVDLVTAVAWRESRFANQLDNLQNRIANNQAIGPMQVKPKTFADVSMDASELLHLSYQNQLQYAVSAGEEYLLKLHVHYLPNHSWCDVLQAYNLGPIAFLSGQRNQAYADSIIAKALTYSELRTT